MEFEIRMTEPHLIVLRHPLGHVYRFNVLDSGIRLSETVEADRAELPASAFEADAERVALRVAQTTGLI